MPTYKISQLSPTAVVSATNEFEINQNSVSKRAPLSALASYVRLTASEQAIAVSLATTSVAALRITQTGTGPALLVEDAATTDSTPFVVDSNGAVVVGHVSVYTVRNPETQVLTSANFNVMGNNFAAATPVFMRVESTASPANLVIAKSRGTLTSPTTITSGDAVGRISFQANTGASNHRFIEAGYIEVQSTGSVSASAIPGIMSLGVTKTQTDIEAAQIYLDQNQITLFATSAINITTSTAAVNVVINSLNDVSRMTLYADTTSTQILDNGAGSLTFSSSGSGSVILGTGTTFLNIDNATSFINLTNASFGRSVPVTKTSSFTVANNDTWHICNGAGTITVTLPNAATYAGRELVFKNIAAQTVISNASNVVPINSATAGTAILPATAGAWATLVSNGTNWVIMQS